MEEDLETAELKEQIDQRVEDHEHHAHHPHPAGPMAMPGWLRYLSLSTAMIAVFAAVASLESGSSSNEAILEKSEAMLNQARASDEWAYFQAKGIKATLSEDFADSLADGAHKTKLTEEGKRYRGETAESKARATKLEDEVKDSNQRCDALMGHHHRFAIAVTLLQIAIALSAIAALTRRKPLWFLGMAVSAGGLAMFVRGFL
jgi:hypothetical protein